MRRLLLILLGFAAATATALETKDVNYSQTSSSQSLNLVWEFEFDTYNSQKCAVITGVKNSGGTTTVTGDLVVPETIIYDDVGYIVKGIAANAFTNQIGISSLTVSKTVQDIGSPFCYGCSLLSAISVDEANPWYTMFNGMLFDRDKETLIACPATMETVPLPSTLTTVGDYAFEGCFRVKSINLPANLESIGDRAFADCPKLKSITFNGDAPATGADVFADTKVTVYVPEGNSTFGSVPGVWQGQSLQYSTGGIVSGITSAVAGNITWYYRVVNGQAELYNNGQSCIGTGVSQSYTWDGESYAWTPDGELRIPSTLGGYPVTRIGENAFLNCSALAKVSIPESVMTIGDFAFRNCSGIKELTLPGNVKSIGYHPFEGSSLTALALPDSLRSLDGNPMAGCDSTLTVTIGADNSFYTVINGLLYDKDVRLLIGCPSRKEAPTITSTCTAIGPEAFCGCFRTSSLIIPDHVTTIGESAFNDMIRLQSVVFPASVTSLKGTGLFVGCTGLEFIGFSGDAPTVEDGLLFGTSADLRIYVRQGTVGWNGDTSSTALPADGKWPASGDDRRAIENLDVSAEADLKEGDVFTLINTNGTMYAWTLKVLANKGLEIIGVSPKPTGSFTIPSEFESVLGTMTVKSIGDRLFANSTGLLSVTIPNSVTNLGDEVFLNCDVLASVSLANGLRSIGRHPFSGTALETVSLPDTVRTIDGNILAGCDPSTGISVGSANPYFSVTDQGVLYDKDFTTLVAVPMTLEEIEIPASVTTFAEECFLGCIRLKKVSFLGDAPTAADGDDLYLDAHASLTNFVFIGNTTFGPVPGTWHLRPIVYWGEAPVEEDGAFKFRIVNGYAEIYNNGLAAINASTTGAVTVPDSLGGHPVKKIGKGAFRDCEYIESVTLPSTVTEIGDYAFYGCRDLSEITLPASLTTIGRQPFYDTALSSLELPARVKSLDGNPAAGCAYLDTVAVDAKNRDFVAEDGLLFNRGRTELVACQAYAEEIMVPASVTVIGTDALSRCFDLVKVTFEGDAPSCPDDLYADCEDVVSYVREDAEGFTSDFWKGRPVVVIGSSSEDDPPGRQEYTDGDGNIWLYTVEGGKARLGYWGETPVLANPDATGTVSVPETLGGYPLSALPDYAFEDCANISVIEIPATITAIGDGAFNGCTALEEIKVDAANPNFRSKYCALYSKDGMTLIKVPARFDFDWTLTTTTTETEKTIQILSQYFVEENGKMILMPPVTNQLSVGEQTIEQSASHHTASISQESLFSGVQRIADYAFTDCGSVSIPTTELSNKIISAVATVVGDNTAVEQTVIENRLEYDLYEPLRIPTSVTEIGTDALIGSHFTEIGDQTTAQFRSSTPTRLSSGTPLAMSVPTTVARKNYCGWIMDNDSPSGTVTLKSNAKNKVSGSVIPLGGKKKTVRSIEEAKAYGDLFIGEVYDGFKGQVWTVAFSCTDNGGDSLLDGLTVLSLTVKAKGKVSVSGYAADGTKISATSQLVNMGDGIYIPLAIQLYTGKRGGFCAIFKVIGDKAELVCVSRYIGKATSSHIALTAIGKPVKLSVGEPECELPTGYSPVTGIWKPKYSQKTGLITASCKVLDPTNKKKTVKIYGVSVDGKGYATSVIPKTLSMPTAFAE